MSTSTLKVKLSVTTAQVSGDTELHIHGEVQNIGTADVDTRTYASTLLVNGKPSESWSWAISSGFRDEREFALPPGEQAEFERKLPASSLLPHPGRYELILDVQGVRSPAVIIEW